MKPKHQRLVFVSGVLAMMAVALTLILKELRENIVYFYAPSALMQRTPEPSQFIRVGGLVLRGSLKSAPHAQHQFVLTDGGASVTVEYAGALPSLFREGQGIIAEGYMQGGRVRAETILAKHDENYMPPEVAKALKEQNYWKEQPMEQQ